jgi:hypothetical protein
MNLHSAHFHSGDRTASMAWKAEWIRVWVWIRIWIWVYTGRRLAQMTTSVFEARIYGLQRRLRAMGRDAVEDDGRDQASTMAESWEMAMLTRGVR